MKHKITHKDIFPTTLNETIAETFPTNTSKVIRVTKTTDDSYIIEWDNEPKQAVLDHVQSIVEKRTITKMEKMTE